MKDHNNDYYIFYFILIIALLWLCLFQQCINGNKLEDIRHEIRIKHFTSFRY